MIHPVNIIYIVSYSNGICIILYPSVNTFIIMPGCPVAFLQYNPFQAYIILYCILSSCNKSILLSNGSGSNESLPTLTGSTESVFFQLP